MIIIIAAVAALAVLRRSNKRVCVSVEIKINLAVI